MTTPPPAGSRTGRLITAITHERERDSAAGAFARVRALHRPVGVVAAAEAGVPPECSAGCPEWPCATHQAVADDRAHPEAAAPAPVDETALRQQLAEAIGAYRNGPASDGRGWFRSAEDQAECVALADAVLPVVRAAVAPPNREQGEDGVTVRPEEYSVTAVPDDAAPDAHVWALTVRHRGGGRWAVQRGEHACLGADGEWAQGVKPYDRGNDWLDEHRFDLPTALRLAREATPHVTVNGYSVADVLAHRESDAPCPQHPNAPVIGGICGGCTQYPADMRQGEAPTGGTR
ncbi:hypothetical protein [Streptomyces sp. NPDC050560]|uniref:hypothetical protein n=1 Tax=Streptomyces sp. NPDC050560 TaxID=3365630 RepID=UPI00379124FA